MAILITNQNYRGLYGEDLNSSYVRVEPKLNRSGDRVDYELYFYKDKASFVAGGLTIKPNEVYSIAYQVTNDGYVLYGLHYLIIQKLLTLKKYDSKVDAEVSVYNADELTIVDIDTP